ncbi:MAG: co-chaperone YbbN [Chloroflexi bacterium]|nr:MAG: co-chaperone YbbN [Chloroflexota bacterium]
MAQLNNIIDVSEATFEYEVIQRSHEIPVVVDFWAPWCGPCHMLGPILERLAADPSYNFVLAKVNVDENPNLSLRFNVQGIPAVKAFLNGQIVGQFVGAQPEPRVRQFIEKIAPSPIEQALAKAQSLLVIRQWEEAEELYLDILDQYPNHPRALLNLARAILGQGRGCEALPYLERCKDAPELAQAERLKPLARYLCQAENGWPDEGTISPIEAQYRQAAVLFERGNIEAALDGLLDVLRQDKHYRNGEPKEIMLGIFELLGDDDLLTQQYRRELASVLF